MTGGGIKTTLVLHGDLDALRCTATGAEPRAGTMLHLQDGPAIPSATAQRLACDAAISVDRYDLGRTSRVVSRQLRRALEARDGRVCSMPGCERTHGLEAHHIEPWEHGGKTDFVNLAFFCRYHHTCFHVGFSVQRRRDGTLIIKDPRGRELYRLPPRASPALAAAA